MAETPNQVKMRELADCLLGVDTDAVLDFADWRGYIAACGRSAALVRNPNVAMQMVVDKQIVYRDELVIAVETLRENVFKVEEQVNSFVSRAKNLGFSPPENPFNEILRMNSGRTVKKRGPEPLTIDNDRATRLLFSLNVFLDLIDAEKRNLIDLRDGFDDAAVQVSSFTMSMDGFEFASGGKRDLLSFVPDLDFAKKKAIEDSVSFLDFGKRSAKIVFTASYEPDGVKRGAIIGWRRMADAGGYLLEREGLFDGTTKTMRFTAEKADEIYAGLRDYVRKWVVTFYDRLDSNRIVAVLDDTVDPDNIYSYTVSGFQATRTTDSSVFDVDTTSARLTKSQHEAVAKLMKKFIDDKELDVGIDAISPFPFVSLVLYGDAKHDWILAGTNFRSLAKRGADRQLLRDASYIGSSYTLFGPSLLSGISVPRDISSVMQKVAKSLTSFGVSQTLLDVIENTGASQFFEKETQTDFVEQLESTYDVGPIDDILSAIDPETATVDVGALISNVKTVGTHVIAPSLGGTSIEDVVVSEVSLPELNKRTPVSTFADDPLQFVSSLDPLGQDVLDLTTTDGIGKLLRVIRSFFDLRSAA